MIQCRSAQYNNAEGEFPRLPVEPKRKREVQKYSSQGLCQEYRNNTQAGVI